MHVCYISKSIEKQNHSEKRCKESNIAAKLPKSHKNYQPESANNFKESRLFEPLLCTVTSGQIEFSLQFAGFQKKQPSSFSSNNHAIVGDPRLAKVVLLIMSRKSELFQTLLAVSEQFQQTAADNAQLRVVQRIECHLKQQLTFTSAHVTNQAYHTIQHNH